MLTIESIRARFPSLERTQDGQPVLFFDNPAGTQVPTDTIEGFIRYFECSNANTGGAFLTSGETDEIIEQARAGMAEFLNAPSPDNVVFGPNMTSLTFQVSQALGDLLQPGDEVVTTRLEHDANVAPWLALQNRGIIVRFIELNRADMTLDLDSADGVITDRTRLVAVGYASNAFGTINDVQRITELAHARGAWVFVDAVHYGPHGPIDVQELGVDLLACSPYKFFGPHLGTLYGTTEVLDRLPVRHVRPAGDISPYKWETGTKNHEALAGLIGTLSYLRSLGDGNLHGVLREITTYERTLSEHLIPGMQSVPGMRIYGITDPAEFDRRVPTVSFTIDGHDPHQVAAALGERGIFSWSGDHYAVEPVAQLGIDATQRIGLVHYNTPEEIDRFVETLKAVV